MIRNFQNIVNAQIEINRATFAYNDFNNDKKLQLNEKALKEYLLKNVELAIKELACFIEKNN